MTIPTRHFNHEPGDHNRNRLIQAWVILVGKARNRQTISYSDLTKLMLADDVERVGNRLGQWPGLQLGQLYTYCERKGLPLLPAIVVGKETGLPADDAPYKDHNRDPNVERERV